MLTTIHVFAAALAEVGYVAEWVDPLSSVQAKWLPPVPPEVVAKAVAVTGYRFLVPNGPLVAILRSESDGPDALVVA